MEPDACVESSCFYAHRSHGFMLYEPVFVYARVSLIYALRARFVYARVSLIYALGASFYALGATGSMLWEPRLYALRASFYAHKSHKCMLVEPVLYNKRL